MPPRARPQSSSRPSNARSSARDSAADRSQSLSAEELALLAQFDLVENALDEFQPPPELASRRELKAAKSAARASAEKAERAHKAGKPAHYFSSSPPLKTGEGKGVRVEVAGADITLQGGAGTFSKSELDEGTQILIETFIASVRAQEAQDATQDAAAIARRDGSMRWCDLGCGWGAVACVLASVQPQAQLWACDINRRAAALAQSNARSLELENTVAWNGDGLSACRDKFFDAILCNPPVRAGNRVIEKLFEDSRRCLQDAGQLWIVLRTSQGAKSWQKKLEAQFGSCDTVQISHGYRVLRARKSHTGEPT